MVIMFKANEIYKNNLVGLLNSQYKTLDGKVRPHYKSDGKPAHTQYITDVTDVYDISKGEFPISTYRAIPWKSISSLRRTIYMRILSTGTSHR